VSEHTTEDTINRLKSLTEKLSLVQDRITIDHAVIEIETAIAERDDARWRLCKVLGDIRDVWGDEIAIEKGWRFDE